jgi:hypothetical protein
MRFCVFCVYFDKIYSPIYLYCDEFFSRTDKYCGIIDIKLTDHYRERKRGEGGGGQGNRERVILENFFLVWPNNRMTICTH